MEEKDPIYLNKELKDLSDDREKSESALKNYKYDIISRLPKDKNEITVVHKNKESKIKGFIEKIRKFL